MGSFKEKILASPMKPKEIGKVMLRYCVIVNEARWATEI